ncbi:MAG: hypothetical protein NXI12_15435 [Alphaproteobacteria bacterium]|nr:hypothetical protein [Alphaproteobacteria bacterium]
MEEAPALSLVVHGRNVDEGDLTILVTREGRVCLRGDLRRVEVPDGPQVVARMATPLKMETEGGVTAEISFSSSIFECLLRFWTTGVPTQA